MKFYSLIIAGFIAFLPFTLVTAADLQVTGSSSLIRATESEVAAAEEDVSQVVTANTEGSSTSDDLGRALASAKLSRATSYRGNALTVTEPESFVLKARPALSPVKVVAQGQEFPSRQAYEAIAALVDDGAISNMTNLDVHQFTYTKAEVLPLVYQAVHRREQMNESDYMRAILLYKEFRQELATYENVPMSRHYLTKDELAKKMENFHIDYSALGK